MKKLGEVIPVRIKPIQEINEIFSMLFEIGKIQGHSFHVTQTLSGVPFGKIFM